MNLNTEYLDKLIYLSKRVEFTDERKERLEYIDFINFFKMLLINKRSNEDRIFFIGNGGSAGIALHMAADYQKTAGIRTQTFYDPTLLTCMANDYGFEYIFSKPLEINANKGDVLVAISSSGESPNIINAVKIAKEIGCKTITFSGFKKDNSLRQMGDINVYVPIEEYGIVESIHNLILQQVIDEIKYELQEGNDNE